MAKILKMPFDFTDRAAATTAPQDVRAEDAATFDVLRRMREDILCCVLGPDQRLRFGELRQRYDTSVGTLREALSHLVSEGLARTEAGRGFSVAPISLADFHDLSELRDPPRHRRLGGRDRQFLLPAEQARAAQDERSGQRQA
jgi:GntR family carbon starvation induced transcriptional regulator